MSHTPAKISNQTLHRLIALNLLLVFLLVSWFVWQNKPVALTQVAAEKKLQCVSYAPYYGPKQTPLDVNTRISQAQIESDLTFLAQKFNCVRTYSVSQGLDHVPVAAEKLGLQVMLGAWIGWVEQENLRELALAIELANAHPSTVKALIIGNEVLLRGEQTATTLKRYLNTAKAQTQTPVTYADVWEFWRKHASLAADVDFITAHILPYWEDDPQSVDHAISHTTNIMTLLEESFQKPIFIGETGWPSEGKQRNTSRPSHVNQAKYIRDFLNTAEEKQWQYNLIEAIDQPWKRQLEGTVGGYWGLYNTDLTPKFSYDQTVAERTDGIHTVVVALASMGVFVMLGLLLKVKHLPTYLYLSLLGLLAGLATVLQLEYLATTSRSQLEWLYYTSLIMIGWGVILGLAILSQKRYALTRKVLLLSFGLFTMTALFTNLTLVVDGRYVNFPIALYLLASIQMLCASFVLKLSLGGKRYLLWLSGALVVSALAGLYQEYNNVFAYCWVLVNGFIVIALLRFAQPQSPSSNRLSE